MEKMAFPSCFIQCLKAIHAGSRARVKAIGSLSSWFTMTRGTRQGCPLSPLLFTLYLEPLAQKTRDSGIHGYQWAHEELKISLYADDIILTLAKPDRQSQKLLDTLREFGEISGYKINADKTQSLDQRNTLERAP